MGYEVTVIHLRELFYGHSGTGMDLEPQESSAIHACPRFRPIPVPPMLAPHAVHYGLADEILAQRQLVLNDAFARHPERFKYIAPTVTPLPTAVWINPPDRTQEAINVPSI
ncbi:MAG: hypothetical protein ACI915_005469 [Gammaproteobacteria bacterium]|jgi:hypothetical protein